MPGYLKTSFLIPVFSLLSYKPPLLLNEICSASSYYSNFLKPAPMPSWFLSLAAIMLLRLSITESLAALPRIEDFFYNLFSWKFSVFKYGFSPTANCYSETTSSYFLYLSPELWSDFLSLCPYFHGV
jgi:hypothetical protein